MGHANSFLRSTDYNKKWFVYTTLGWKWMPPDQVGGFCDCDPDKFWTDGVRTALTLPDCINRLDHWPLIESWLVDKGLIHIFSTNLAVMVDCIDYSSIDRVVRATAEKKTDAFIVTMQIVEDAKAQQES